MSAEPRTPESLLEAYRVLSRPGTIERLKKLASSVAGRRVLHLYSPGLGNERSLMIHRLGALMEGVGVLHRWDVVVGTERFFEAVQILRRALLGEKIVIPPETTEAYLDCVRENSARVYLGADYVIVHDFQPIGIVDRRRDDARWIWRCHLDVSRATSGAWRFLKGYLRRYDAAVFSHPSFARKAPVPRVIIPPSIDPLHERNWEISRREIEQILSKLQVPLDRPMVMVAAEANRFDSCVSLVEAILASGGRRAARVVVAVTGESQDFASREDARRLARRGGVHVLGLSPESHREANALGRAASVCVHPLRERGLGISILENLWRCTPVVSGIGPGRVIPVRDGETGFVARSVREAVAKTERILGDARLARKMGEKGRELVRERYLLTRHVEDYLVLLDRLEKARR